ncbi:MAG TPA: hypothetical protein VGN18_14410 [Jatrophihabitans sp.]|jgi:hypothetical protein|uniref:hypothetical protein n=1 Tax=Jatrophihabitans sp. TaxID=1932789 RepID=UPI002E0293CF|nr:hypothetical protein [Jatrophihabitans sp.]
MSDHFEDELRATMRDHDHEAPAAGLPDFRAADAPRVPTGGRYTWLPIAAAAAAVLTLVGITFALGPGENRGAPKAGAAASVTSSAGRAAGALSCPDRYVTGRNDIWVPAQPVGLDGAARLAPDRTPAELVVCAYLNPSGASLSGSRAVTGDLARVTPTLTWQPRLGSAPTACASYLATTDSDNYLLGLTYRGATEWISVPGNHCAGASNGRFRTVRNLRALAESTYRSGVWPAKDAMPAPCTGFAAGRLGQETVMVPDHPTAVTICTYRDGRRPVRTDRVDINDLVAALDALRTSPSTHTCQGSPTDATYELEFTYRDGPPVWVRVSPGCTPSVDNGNLQASDANSVLAPLHALLG